MTHDQFRLYSIIWERFVSSQMNNAKMVTTSVEITAGDAIFRVAASKIAEKGFYQVIKLLSSKEDKSTSLPAMKEGEEYYDNRDQIVWGDHNSRRKTDHISGGNRRISVSETVCADP